MKYIALLLCLALAQAAAAQNVELVELQHPAAGPVMPGTSDHEIMVFRLYKNSGSAASNLTQLRVAFLGTATSSDWVAVDLYWDVDRSRTVSTGDVSLATASVLSGGKATFTGLNHAIQSGFSSGYDYLVVVDVAGGATVDRTFEFETVAADVTVSAGTVSASLGDVLSNVHTVRVDNGCEIDVRLSGTPITSGASHNVGYIPVAGGNLTFDIFNTGTGTLDLTGTPLVAVTTSSNCAVTLTSPPGASVAPSTSTSFTINVDPVSALAFSFTLEIENNDYDEFPYYLLCYGSATPVPEMDVEYNSTPVPDGWQIALGSYTAGIPASIDVTIINSGSGPLNLTGTPIVDFPGELNVNCVLSVAPTTPVASGGGMTTFTIQFTPAGSGSWAFEVLIFNDDAAVSQYDFQFSGTSPAVTPTQLGVFRQPGNALAKQAFGVQPVVSVQDVNGAVNTSDNSTVVVASLAGGGAGGASLSGTLTATCVNGYATFANLKINLEGMGYTLNFTHQAGTLTATTSAPFDVGPAPPKPPKDDDGGGDDGGGCSTDSARVSWLALLALAGSLLIVARRQRV